MLMLQLRSLNQLSEKAKAQKRLVFVNNWSSSLVPLIVAKINNFDVQFKKPSPKTDNLLLFPSRMSSLTHGPLSKKTYSGRRMRLRHIVGAVVGFWEFLQFRSFLTFERFLVVFFHYFGKPHRIFPHIDDG
jgi:hypothetical protein